MQRSYIYRENMFLRLVLFPGHTIPIRNISPHTHTHTHTHTYTQTHTHTHADPHTHVHTHTHTPNVKTRPVFAENMFSLYIYDLQ